jgi:hypothetical protein
MCTARLEHKPDQPCVSLDGFGTDMITISTSHRDIAASLRVAARR